jgi:hypothetical protein
MEILLAFADMCLVIILTIILFNELKMAKMTIEFDSIEDKDEMEKAEKIKAQIDVLKLAHLRLSVEGIDKADDVMIFTINELEQQLKELTSKTDKE